MTVGPDWCRWSSTTQQETLCVRQNVCRQMAGRASQILSWTERHSSPWSSARDSSRVREVRCHWVPTSLRDWSRVREVKGKIKFDSFLFVFVCWCLMFVLLCVAGPLLLLFVQVRPSWLSRPSMLSLVLVLLSRVHQQRLESRRSTSQYHLKPFSCTQHKHNTDIALLLLYVSGLWLQSGVVTATGSTSSSLGQSEQRYGPLDRSRWCLSGCLHLCAMFIVVYLLSSGSVQPSRPNRSLWEGDDRPDPNRSTRNTWRNSKPGSVHEQRLCYMDVWSCEFRLILDPGVDCWSEIRKCFTVCSFPGDSVWWRRICVNGRRV